MLYLKIKDLNKKLEEGRFFTQNDLFVKIKYGKQERVTTTLWDNNNPNWNEAFIFDLEDEKEELILELYDKDTYSRDELLYTTKFKPDLNSDIKHVSISIFNVMYGNIMKNTYKLKGENKIVKKKNAILKKENENLRKIINKLKIVLKNY